MTGCTVGSQAWYDSKRKRLIDISDKLRNSDISQDDKNRLYEEQLTIIVELDEHATEDLVNAPIV